MTCYWEVTSVTDGMKRGSVRGTTNHDDAEVITFSAKPTRDYRVKLTGESPLRGGNGQAPAPPTCSALGSGSLGL